MTTANKWWQLLRSAVEESKRERVPSLACIHTASAYVSVFVCCGCTSLSCSSLLKPNSNSQMHLVVVVVVAHFCTLRCCCNWFSLLFTLILSGFAPIIWLISTMNIYNISLRYAIFSHLFDARMHTHTHTDTLTLTAEEEANERRRRRGNSRMSTRPLIANVFSFLFVVVVVSVVVVVLFASQCRMSKRKRRQKIKRKRRAHLAHFFVLFFIPCFVFHFVFAVNFSFNAFRYFEHTH